VEEPVPREEQAKSECDCGFARSFGATEGCAIVRFGCLKEHLSESSEH